MGAISTSNKMETANHLQLTGVALKWMRQITFLLNIKGRIMLEHNARALQEDCAKHKMG